MNEIVFLLCQKPSTALKYLLIYNVFTRAAEGTEAGDGVNVGHSLSPPSHFMLATGLLLHVRQFAASNQCNRPRPDLLENTTVKLRSVYVR